MNMLATESPISPSPRLGQPPTPPPILGSERAEPPWNWRVIQGTLRKVGWSDALGVARAWMELAVARHQAEMTLDVTRTILVYAKHWNFRTKGEQTNGFPWEILERVQVPTGPFPEGSLSPTPQRWE